MRSRNADDEVYTLARCEMELERIPYVLFLTLKTRSFWRSSTQYVSLTVNSNSKRICHKNISSLHNWTRGQLDIDIILKACSRLSIGRL